MRVHLSALFVALSVSFSSIAAVSQEDIQGAKVVTVTTEVVSGHLNIANGRNCLDENDKGKPTLLVCNSAAETSPEKTTLHFIVLKSGQCLSDEGGTTPVMAACDYQNTTQQWQARQGFSTEVRNVASNKCLTAAGLDKPVTIAACAGLPAQNWKLPE